MVEKRAQLKADVEQLYEELKPSLDVVAKLGPKINPENTEGFALLKNATAESVFEELCPSSGPSSSEIVPSGNGGDGGDSDPSGDSESFSLLRQLESSGDS